MQRLLLNEGESSSDCRDDGTSPCDADLSEVASRMSKAIKLRDRVHRLKEYKCCFKGTDAVRWMLENGVAPNVEEAEKLGNRLREQGFIRHVTNAHTFHNKDHYYWFHESIVESCACSPSSSYTSILGWRGTVTPDDYDLGNELIQLQRTVHEIRTEMTKGFRESSTRVTSLSQRVDQLEKRIQREAALQQWNLNLMALAHVTLVLMMNVHWFVNTLALIFIVHTATRLIFIPRVIPVSHRIRQQTEECNSASSGEDTSSEEVTVTATGVTVQDFVEWPDAPCLLFAPPCLLHPSPRKLRCNQETPFTFETELFRGCALFWVDSLPSTPPSYFTGKKRKSFFVVQGRFKEALAFEQVLSGQQFAHPIRDIPAEFLLKAILKVAKSLNPSSHHQLSPHPQFLTNLISTAQSVNVSLPGDEPSLLNATEDMRFVSGAFRDDRGDPINSACRKRLVFEESHRLHRRFDTECVWTFSFWQHLLDLSTYQLDLGIKRIHLLHHLNGQPLQLMARHGDGRLLWNFEIWHRDLL